MAEIAYQDFDLSLDAAPPGFRATVRESPAGSASSDFVLPFESVKLENYILRLGRVRRGVRRLESPETQAAREFGGALFQAVFAGEVRACLRSSLDETLRRGEGLRLRLRVNAPALWGLPWEYLYYPTRNQFLALSVHSPLVRYIELAEPIPVLAVEPPLRVLTMIASPSDHPPLDVEREWRLLNEAVGTLHPARRVVLERLQEPTLSALQRRLRREDYHVFHFIGHGGYDQEKDEGVLLLEDEEKKGDIVSSRHLGMLLHDHRPLRVAVLNACEGARSSLVDPFAGSAQTLVQQGLPAVIAMQFEIGDEVATTFAQELYGALSDGYPIDAAVTESRKAIFTSGQEVAWGTPVLYMRTPDGRIFDVKGTGHPVPGLGLPSEERRRAKVRAVGAGAGQDVLAPAPDWALLSSDPIVDPPATDDRKRLSEAQTLEHVEPEPESVAALLDRARDHAGRGRHSEALHLVGQALGREPGSIDARVLKRHLLHEMGSKSAASRTGERLVAIAQVAARPVAGLLALVVLAILAIALATWRAPRPVETSATQKEKDPKPEQTVARVEPTPTTTSSATPATPPAEVRPTPPPTSAVKPTVKPRPTPEKPHATESLPVTTSRPTPTENPPSSSDTEPVARKENPVTPERQARRALADGQRERALAIASDALRVTPTDQGVRDFLTQFARDSMNAAIAARSAATHAGRAARRSSAFALGDSHFERAEKSHAAGHLTDAIPAYWSAQTQFERALKDVK